VPEQTIPIADLRYAAARASIPAQPEPPVGILLDRRARPLHDLRISVTDRCNFRCTYCMPKEVFDAQYPYLPQSSLLSFEEITRITRIFVAHGVEKLRLTGGEPLLRKNLEILVEQLSSLRTPAGTPVEVTLTTNGVLLQRKARALAQAGLRRITVSLDALDDATFQAMNDVGQPVAQVLAGIDAARAEGLSPIKVNMVVRRGLNDHDIVPMARYFRGTGHVLRFIEYMDVGASNGWQLDQVVPSREVIERIREFHDLEQIDPNYEGEVAQRWRYRDGSGEIGVISSVTQPFCADCSRARLSTEGRLYTCLFANTGHDIRSLLRGQFSDLEIASAIGLIWRQRNDRYSEIRGAAGTDERRIEMSYIGG